LAKGQKGARVLDLGASWGYGTWQFIQDGFEATGYEPGRARARYALERLGLPVVDDIHTLNGDFDIIISSHVMEHVPKPCQVIEQLRVLPRLGRVFVALTPNGSAEYMRASAASYHRHWGMVLTNYLDEHYCERAFAPWPTLMSKTQVAETQIRAWNRHGSTQLKLDGWELLALALRPE
jgi:2-polyprenyl-3-methyl-5-hydroxy-6-metoxy-1,4-benzoquinol methylase